MLDNKIGPFPICASVWKRVLSQNLYYKDEFNLPEIESVGGTHFHLTRFKAEAKGHLVK